MDRPSATISVASPDGSLLYDPLSVTTEAEMTDETMERSIDIEPSPTFSGRSAYAVTARINLLERTRALGLNLSTSDSPVTINGEDVAHNGGYPGRDDLPDVLAWILPEEEMETFAARATRTDPDWGWFPQATLERQREGEGGNLCVAIGTAKGEMAGFLVLKRGIVMSSRTDMSYHLTFDRAYLLPQARGQGLAAALVAVASLVSHRELHDLARAITPARGKASLTVFVGGEAESAGGAWMLKSLADEFEDICDGIEKEHGKITVEGLEVDIEPYEPDDDDAPGP